MADKLILRLVKEGRLRPQKAGVVQIEVMPQPPECRDERCPWPAYPLLLKTTSSHEEGANRHWSILTKKFIGEGRAVKKIACVKVEFTGGRMQEVACSGFEIEADLIILAVGFILQEPSEWMKQPGIFIAGDMRRGPSLIVWAIAEGRAAARAVDEYLLYEQQA